MVGSRSLLEVVIIFSRNGRTASGYGGTKVPDVYVAGSELTSAQVVANTHGSTQQSLDDDLEGVSASW